MKSSTGAESKSSLDQTYLCTEWNVTADTKRAVTFTRNALIDLKEKNAVKILISANLIQSTSFTGFLYAQATRCAIWCLQAIGEVNVYLSKGDYIQNTANEKTTQPANIQFNHATILIGSNWNSSTNEVKIYYGGIFYISFTITAEKCPLKVNLCANEEEVSILEMKTCDRSVFLPREKTSLHKLNISDNLRVKLSMVPFLIILNSRVAS